MRYMLLIYSDQSGYGRMSEQEMGKLMEAYGKFHESITSSGVSKAGDRLRPTEAATTVRIRGRETLTTDGPFAETKEQLGGYYLIDVKDLDEALKWAARVPTATYGSIEVRPVWEDGEQ